jgi:hypothetical protein
MGDGKQQSHAAWLCFFSTKATTSVRVCLGFRAAACVVGVSDGVGGSRERRGVVPA